MSVGRLPVEIGPEESAVFLGMKGTGKTTAMRFAVEAARPKVAVFDPLGQYDKQISYRPPALDARHVDDVARRAWHLAPFMLAVEEAEYVLREGRPLPPAFQQYLQLGRNLRLRFVCNARRPQKLHKDVLDESDHVFIFKLAGRALDYMVDYLGSEDGPRLRAMRKWTKDPRRGGGRFFHYHDGDLTEHEPLRLR